MTYNPNIPQASDDPSDSQGQILTNFGQLNTLFDKDHVAYNDATSADRGQHRKVSLINVIADPGLAAPKATLYTKAVNTQNQLFFQNDSAGTDVYQITGGGGAATTWVNFNGNVPVGPIAPNQNLNVASVTKNSTANYTVTFSKNYKTADYCVLVKTNSVYNFVTSTKNVGSIIISSTSGAAIDASDVNIIIFGDLD